MPTSSLVTVAKRVIREAGKMGLEAGKVVLDEAGSRVCGPTAWKYLKRILSPVVTELEKGFPKLLLDPQEANKGAEALSKDTALQDMLHSGFERLESGQEEIMAALARQNETLNEIGEAINTGFLEAGEQRGEAFNAIRRELSALRFEIAGLQAVPQGKVAPGLSIAEINDQASKLQWDAMKWVVGHDAKTASQRLTEARGLLEAGLKSEPNHAGLLACFGFVQKTQAQIAQLEGNYQEYVNSLAEAAKYFGQVLKSDATNAGALNGMANIYLFDKDYDRAIQLGTLAVHRHPNYGAAWWDLALALEGKMGLIGQTPELVQHLKSVYQNLQNLMPKQPQAFTANELAHVQDRLAALERL